MQLNQNLVVVIIHLYLGNPMINWRESQKKWSVAHNGVVEVAFFSWLKMQISPCQTASRLCLIEVFLLGLFYVFEFSKDLMNCTWNLISVLISFCSLMKKYMHSNADFMCLNSFEYLMRKMQRQKYDCASPGWMEIS